MTAPTRSDIEARFREIQSGFASAMEEIDGTGRFVVDPWKRHGGGGGETRILQGEGPIEKAAVNFSAVWGETPAVTSEGRTAGSGSFYATGLSIIVHPRNPHAPTFHANLRYFDTDGAGPWFGGGADLTPYYLVEEDVRHFHRVLREVCGRHPVADHGAWKGACDEYFRLPHRDEARGVGGLFFDHLSDRLADVWAFQQDLGESLGPSYVPILSRRLTTPYTAEEERWHLRRRGRYAEFNLVWDRGTRFGLETGGRTESILASLPPRVRWDYAAEPQPGTREAELLEVLRSPPRDWAAGEER